MGAGSNVIALKGVQAFATNRRSPVHPRMPPPDTIAAVKGFRDVLPDESRRWRALEEAAERVFTCYGFGEIRLPVVERTELFARSLDKTTDIVEKEMYSFADRDETGLTLRPEATAGVVRAYLESGLEQSDPSARLYYRGPMFRRERPQRGRYRQFYQIGAEVLGRDDPLADAELLVMLDRYLAGAGGLGAQNAVGGGGRYDGLVAALGGPDVAGVGFALGLERLAMVAPEVEAEAPGPTALILPLDVQAVGPALALATRLRDGGLAVGLEPAGRSLKALLRIADRRHARLAVMLGEEEVRAGRATVRDLVQHQDRRQVLPLEAGGPELVRALQAMIGGGH